MLPADQDAGQLLTLVDPPDNLHQTIQDSPVGNRDHPTFQPGQSPQAEPANPRDDGPSTLLSAARAALTQVQTDSRPFVERLEDRLGRDRKRFQDCYHALLREDRRRAERRAMAEAAGPDPARSRATSEAKAKAVQLELRRKLAELDERYACQVELAPRTLVRLDCPALAVKCHVQRRAATAMHTLFWNPITKELEPMACSRCGVSTFAVAVAALCAVCAG